MAKKDLMKLTDLSKDELNEILKVAADYKKNRHGYKDVLQDKTIGTIFLKNSTRTRVSFETGINQLGGYPMYLDDKSLQIGRGESFHDTAKVLSRYLEGIVIRGHEHESIKEFADACDIPVINALTDKYHPCQLLADMQAMIEVRGSLEGAKVAFYGDCASNMANSFVLAASMTGMDLRMAGPQGYQPEKWLMDEAGNPSNVTVTDDAMAAAKDCDFLVTDVWISMGFEEEAAERSKNALSVE